MLNNTVYEWILRSTFTVAARAESLQKSASNLSKLIRPGDKILDLCCGSGYASFWLEERGAQVTGVDFAPYMIALAKEEAQRRNSTVEFLEADIFAYDFGRECFNLITCFGNSISDFPLSDFAKLSGKISNALKPGGRFAIEYVDGIYNFTREGALRNERILQETPERITARFKEYLPDVGARVGIVRNETRGEEYERKVYLYAPPTVQLALTGALELEQHIALDVDYFLDIFVKQKAGAK